MRENGKDRRPKQCFCFVEHLQKGRNMPRFNAAPLNSGCRKLHSTGTSSAGSILAVLIFVMPRKLMPMHSTRQ